MHGDLAWQRRGSHALVLLFFIESTTSILQSIQKQEDEEMDSWVLSTFLVLTIYMLVHSGAAYMRRELKRKRKEQREKQRG